MMDGKGRSTGHFGTGAYFFSDRESAEEYDDRDVTAVDVSEYNLAPASKELHDALRDVNDLYNPFTQDFREKDEFSTGDFIRVTKALGRYNEVFPDIEFADINASDEVFLKQQRKFQEQQNREAKLLADAKRMYNEPGNVDSRSTVVMKLLGYDGVYAAPGSDMDTFQYGTVIYDVKAEPRAAEQRVTPQRFGAADEKYLSTNADQDIKPKDGHVILYHRTSAESADAIAQEGFRPSLERVKDKGDPSDLTWFTDTRRGFGDSNSLVAVQVPESIVKNNGSGDLLSM
jgi:hypothetical protein